MPGAILYDKYKKIDSLEEINKTDIIFICVPTPYSRGIGCDLSAVKEALSFIKGKKIVVIKSTVLPGTTERMQKKYSQHKILFNPEFLREKTAIKEMKNPYEQIIGYTKKSKSLANEILEILPKAPAELIIPATEAEMIKYFFNTFLATKVIFANQIYDLCQKLNINYDLIKKIAKISPRLAFSHFDIWTDGYRGYAGKCLPKDTKSLIQFGDRFGVNLDLLKSVDKINEKLLKKRK
jgi:UDPglucose 6-dehydrogenase